MAADDGARDVAANAWVEVDFTPDPGFQLLFDGLTGEEELGRPFLYHLDLSSGTLHSDIAQLVGASATVWMAQSDQDADDRFLNGIVTRIVSTGLSAGAYRYRVELRPWIWLLTRATDCRIFQSKSAFQIISAVFRDARFSDFEDRRQAGAGDTQLDYCVQYRETSYDFVMRLMEQFGLYYYFRHERDLHTLVIADDPNAHRTLEHALPFVFDQTEFRTVADHFWEWSTDLALHSGKFTFRDYNFTTPSADLTAKTVQAGQHPHGSMEVYEYPGPYDVAATGHRMTDIRMQAISRDRAVFRAVGNSRKPRVGTKFKLTNHPDRVMNREYLITRAAFSMSLAEGSSTVEGETIDTYRVTVHAIPADVPFRLDRLTPRPMIRGPQTAVVMGKSGDEITTDEYGRVKLRFHWDRSDAEDDQRTCWVRVAQVWAGSAWGSLVIPRVGHEVVVEFLEGNPDRPLVTGSVYNATMRVPYALPDNKTQSGLKSSSSTGGSGANELRFEDRAGQEEVFFQAQKDFNKVVLNNETVKIHKDTTTTVETGDRAVVVSQGGDKLTVSTGDHTITISAGQSTITAARSITLSVGANSITIDTTGVSINGTKVALQSDATMSLQAGATMSLTGATISLN